MKVKLPQLKINKSKVAKAVVLTALILALAGLGTLVARDWQEQKNKDAAQAQAQRQAADKALTAQRAKIAHAELAEAGYTRVHLECEKGKAAYELLTPIQKRSIKPQNVPNCGAALLQP
jgi:Na+-transporting methylmalonyl-CoA/oxaloacetate decarboxylase gamma subunit